MEPSTVFAGARLFGAVAKQIYRASTPDHAVSVTIREWSPTYSLFVPNVDNLDECAPPTPDDIVMQTNSARDWVKRHQALPIGGGEFGLVIQAKGNASVVIDGIRVLVAEAETVQGIALRQALAGPIVALSLEVDLDAAQVRCIDSRDRTDKTIDTVFSVSSGDPLVFRVSGWSDTKAYLWQLELSMIVDGRAITRRVPAEVQWITLPYNYEGVQCAYHVSSSGWELSD